ncbi:hypothetical protein DRJ19_03785 [Candidatus Woesearchaeota archaeon]|nr:MAG: hypothetical protein DRJ19_03785 [Candidatus Woesearchaeota archaeon]
MKVTEIYVERLLSDPISYSNRRLGVKVIIGEGEDWKEAFFKYASEIETLLEEAKIVKDKEQIEKRIKELEEVKKQLQELEKEIKMLEKKGILTKIIELVRKSVREAEDYDP